MTVNTQSNKTIALGDGVTTQFAFGFVGVSSAFIAVILTDSSGNETVLSQGSGSSQYQIVLNAPVTGAIWGLGGTVTYNPGGTPIPAGSTLTIFRTLPLTQAISLQNQPSLATLGNGAETGLDTLAMQLQQVSENIARAIVAPIVDATPPAPLPPIAQRANKGAAFDGQGNLVAGTTPTSGIISTAMQPVVDAATLALGRTAFGLGAMATEGIGAGLQDDGAGNARVIFGVQAVSTNQAIHAASHLVQYNATGPITFTLDRANTLFNGFGFWVYVTGGALTLTPNASDNFKGYSSGQSVILPTGTAAFISTDAASSGTWVVDWGLSQGPPMAGGSFAGLTIANNVGTPNSKIDVSATEFVLPGSIGGAIRSANPSFTINCAVNGANGLDVGTLAASTWYYLWAISNGATVAGLASLSATAPTLPTGFVYAKRIGAVFTDGSANFYRFLQKANRTKYVVTPATNMATPRQIINQTAAIGSVTVPTYISFSVANFVPPTALAINLQVMSVSGTAGNNFVLIAPNNNSGVYNSTTNMPPITSTTDQTGNQQITQGFLASLMLESSNIFAAYLGASGSPNLTVAAEGWIDNL